MGKIIFIIFLLFPTILFSQNKKIVVEFDKNDSIIIKKRNNNIYISIFYEKNIEYNKSKEKRHLPDDKILCEECKNEFDLMLVSKPKKRIKNIKNIKIIPAKEWKRKYYLGQLNAEHFMEYIKIGKYYYKNLGIVMID